CLLAVTYVTGTTLQFIQPCQSAAGWVVRRPPAARFAFSCGATVARSTLAPARPLPMPQRAATYQFRSTPAARRQSRGHGSNNDCPALEFWVRRRSVIEGHPLQRSLPQNPDIAAVFVGDR